MPNRLQSFPSPALRERGGGAVSPHWRGEGEILISKKASQSKRGECHSCWFRAAPLIYRKSGGIIDPNCWHRINV